MTHMETQSEALDRLAADGFTSSFDLTENGRLRSDGSEFDPPTVAVHEIVRFEGMSDPDDEAMLLAIETTDGTRGTLLMPYGPDMSAAQVEASKRLIRRPGRSGSADADQ